MITLCRDAKLQFLKYSAPLFHLSGIDVTVVEVKNHLSLNHYDVMLVL